MQHPLDQILCTFYKFTKLSKKYKKSFKNHLTTTFLYAIIKSQNTKEGRQKTTATYYYKGYTISPFKDYYIIYNSDGDEVASVDNINDAKYHIDNINNN